MDNLLNALIVSSNIMLVIATLVAVHHADKEAQLTARQAIRSENKLASTVIRMFGKTPAGDSARHLKGGQP